MPYRSAMEQWNGRVALVTGASRGIGAAIAQFLVEAGLVVVGVARDTDRMEQMSLDYKSQNLLGSFVPMRCNIGDLQSVQDLFVNIKADPDLEGVDVCINNAAVGNAESFLSGNPEEWRTMVDINFLGAAYITHESVKSMRARSVNDGHIIFINSLSGHRLIPGNKDLHMYTATKFAIRAMLEGVRCELRAMDVGIRVSAVSPGVVETDIFKKLFEGDEEKSKSFLSERKYLTADDIASTVVYILSQPAHVQIHDITMRSTEQIP